jgi:hypothetical protein
MKLIQIPWVSQVPRIQLDQKCLCMLKVSNKSFYLSIIFAAKGIHQDKKKVIFFCFKNYLISLNMIVKDRVYDFFMHVFICMIWKHSFRMCFWSSMKMTLCLLERRIFFPFNMAEKDKKGIHVGLNMWNVGLNCILAD